jgi:Ribosomal protein L9, N-terminal domain
MASPLVSKTPQCLSCIRRITGSLRDVFQVPGHQQIRGKKRLAKVSTVKVHLLQNVPGYGRRGILLSLRYYSTLIDANLQPGAVIPVTRGMMRNIWYPKKMAEYLTTAKLQQLGVKKDTAVERDSTFRSNTERKLDKEKEKRERKIASAAAEAEVFAVEQEPVLPIELELLSVRLPRPNRDTRTCLLTSI